MFTGTSSDPSPTYSATGTEHDPAMKKVINQFVITLAVFLLIWFLAGRIPFTRLIDFKAISRAGEEKLGNLSLDLLRKTDRPVISDSVVYYLDSIRDRICKANGIDPAGIHIYPFFSTEVNAFTLPGGNIVIYSGLIGYCNNGEELAAVMAHEIGHIEHRHVMKKLSKEMGISVLLAVTAGGTGAEFARNILKTLSSTAFDRKMEKEADSTAVRYLARADIHPRHFADLLFRFSKDDKDLPGSLEWISTHPESRGRAVTVLALSKNLVVKDVPVLSSAEWTQMQRILRTY